MKKIKILGIFLSMLLLVTLLPMASATVQTEEKIQQKPDQELELRPMFRYAMISGRMSNVREIGSIIIGKAERISYVGLGSDVGVDWGTVRNQMIMFRETPRFRMMTLGTNVYVSGNVVKLRLL